MTSDLLDGFARAIVHIVFPDGERILQPQRAGEVENAYPFTAPVHIVTASNPLGSIADHASNEANHRRLLDHAKSLGVETVPTIGSAPDGSIPEPGILIEGLDRSAAVALGDEFGQSAIYEWSEDRLEILGVRYPQSRTLGWRLFEKSVWDDHPH